MKLAFDTQFVEASFLYSFGDKIKSMIEIRTNPVTSRTSRITYARIKEKETGTQCLPPNAPEADNIENCPFCYPQILKTTPLINSDIYPDGRIQISLWRVFCCKHFR